LRRVVSITKAAPPPGSAICLLALPYGRDGVVICIGFDAAVLAFVIVTVASAGVVNAVHHWITAKSLALAASER
jgi:hypothetical protein